MASSQEINKLLERFNRSKQEAEDNVIANSIMDAVSQIAKPLGKLKLAQQLAPTLAGATGLGPLPAIAMASTAFRDPFAHIKQLDQRAQQRVINTIEKRPGYNNAVGDTAARSAMGLNNLGLSLGTSGALLKAAGMAGYTPNILENVNPLLLMGAMQGGKGVGTFAAGAAGGFKGLGALFGAGTGAGTLGAINPALLGFAAMMALNIGGSKLNTMMLNAGSTKLNQFRANTTLNLRSGFELEMHHSNMVNITSQIKLLQNIGQLSPAEALHAQILMLIESHTSVIPLMVEEILNAREIKDKSGGNAGQNAVSEFFGEDGLLPLYNQRGTKLQPNFIQRWAKEFARSSSNVASILDIFGQIGNTLSGKSSVAEFNKANRKFTDMNADQAFSDKFGIAVSMVNTIHTSAAEVLSKAQTFEAKQIAILSGMYELNRFQAHELLSIRRDGMGVDRPGHAGELAKLRVQEEMDGEDPESLGRLVDEMLGYLPLWHTISGSAKMVMAGYNNIKDLVTGTSTPFSNMMKDIRNAITETFTSIDQDEGSLRNTIGATILAPADLMARYLSGDYVKQMTELVEYNRAQAHYLKYLATDASSRSKIPLTRLNTRAAVQLDEFSGKLMTDKEFEERDNAIGKKLAEALTSTSPNGLMGVLTTMFIDKDKQKERAEDYATTNFKHIEELWKQFGSTSGYLNGRGFDEGGKTGKASPGTKPDSSGHKPVGIVHEDEYVVPKWYADKNKDLMGMLEKDRTNRTSQTSTMLADALHSKEVEETKLNNELKQTETQTGMLGFLKKISEGIDGVNHKLLHPKTPVNDDLWDALKLIGAGLGGLALLNQLKDLLGEHTGLLAAIGAALGLPIAARLLKSIPPGLISGAAAGAAAGYSKFKTDWSKGKYSFTQHGPALPDGMKPSKWDSIKNFAQQHGSMDNLKGGLKDSLKLGGKALLKTGPLALLFGGIDYFLQSDVDENGNQRTIGDKLSSVGKDFLDNAGAILGSVILGGLGAIAPIPGGAIIGSVLGGIAGSYIQEKFTDYWKSYAQHKDGTNATTGEKIKTFLKNNVGAVMGAGIGAGLGFVFGGGPIGGAAGIIIGGLIGAGVHNVISKITTTISEFDFGAASSKLGDWASENIPGVEQGAKVGRLIFGDNPFGSFIGGLIGGAIMGPGGLLVKFGQKMAEWFGDGSSVDHSPSIVDRQTQAKGHLASAEANYEAAKERYEKTKTPENAESLKLAKKHFDETKAKADGTYEKGMFETVKGLNSEFATNINILNKEWFKKTGERLYGGKDGAGVRTINDTIRMLKEGYSASPTSAHFTGLAADMKIKSGRYQELLNLAKTLNLDLKTYNGETGNLKQYIHLEDATTSANQKQFGINKGLELIKTLRSNPEEALAVFKKQKEILKNGKASYMVTAQTQNAKQMLDDLEAKLTNTKVISSKITKEKLPSISQTQTAIPEAKVEYKTTEAYIKEQNDIRTVRELRKKKEEEQLKNLKEAKLTQTSIADASIKTAEAAEANLQMVQIAASKLDQLNNRVAELSQMINDSNKVAKTLWSYIDKVYKEPKYSDYQFAYLTK